MTDPTEQPVLVTGGTGTLGRLVVRRLVDAGWDVRVLTRQRQPSGLVDAEVRIGDLLTGAGVHEAVRGVATIVQCASARKGDVEATAHLLAAASTLTPRPHLVFVSIVGWTRGRTATCGPSSPASSSSPGRACPG